MSLCEDERYETAMSELTLMTCFRFLHQNVDLLQYCSDPQRHMGPCLYLCALSLACLFVLAALYWNSRGVVLVFVYVLVCFSGVSLHHTAVLSDSCKGEDAIFTRSRF